MPRIVIISDTHQLHEQVSVPDGDILIHCGDFTNTGTDENIIRFLQWFVKHPHYYKIFICGNHEVGTDKEPHRARKLEIIKYFTDNNLNLFYLENSGITIEEYDLKVWGSPITPFFFDWSWNVHRGAPIASFWKDIPDDTNILITHGQPYGINDLVLRPDGRDPHQGCHDLLNRINQLQVLKLYCGGHLHTNNGDPQMTMHNNIPFVNASICNDQHQPVNKPVIIDL